MRPVVLGKGAEQLPLTYLNPTKKLDVLTFTDELIQFSRNETIIQKLTALKKLLADDSDPCHAAEILGRSILIHESMPFAIFSFLSKPYSFERCLMTAILNGGDCDTLGAMAGGLSGAFLGVEVIPNLWQSKLENFSYIRQLAANLFNMAILSNTE